MMGGADDYNRKVHDAVSFDAFSKARAAGGRTGKSMSIATVAVLVGNHGMAAYNRRITGALAQLAPSALELRVVALSVGDLDPREPPTHAWYGRREAIDDADAILLVTSEPCPSVLQDSAAPRRALDLEFTWDEKPVAVISATPRIAGGGFAAIHHLQRSLVFMNIPRPARFTAPASTPANLFDQAGKPANQQARDFLSAFLEAFSAWVAAHRSHRLGAQPQPDLGHVVAAARNEMWS